MVHTWILTTKPFRSWAEGLPPQGSPSSIPRCDSWRRRWRSPPLISGGRPWWRATSRRSPWGTSGASTSCCSSTPWICECYYIFVVFFIEKTTSQNQWINFYFFFIEKNYVTKPMRLQKTQTGWTKMIWSIAVWETSVSLGFMGGP